MTQAFNLGSAANNFSSTGVSGLVYQLNTGVIGANSTSAQSVFGVGVTLSPSTVYQFEALYLLAKSAGTTTHTIATLFGGTATLNSISYCVIWNGAASYNNANSGPYFTASTQATATTITLAVGVASWTTEFKISGTVSVNTGGTFIPQYQLSAAPGGAYTTQPGSYFTLTPIGAAGSNVNVGGWA